jgi:hypothetical protein
MGLWRMCKYEVLLLVIAELSWYYYYVNLKESQLSGDCLKRGCLRGVLKMLAVQGTGNLCNLTSVTLKSDNPGITVTQWSLLRSTQNKNCMILASNVHEIYRVLLLVPGSGFSSMTFHGPFSLSWKMTQLIMYYLYMYQAIFRAPKFTQINAFPCLILAVLRQCSRQLLCFTLFAQYFQLFFATGMLFGCRQKNSQLPQGRAAAAATKPLVGNTDLHVLGITRFSYLAWCNCKYCLLTPEALAWMVRQSNISHRDVYYEGI